MSERRREQARKAIARAKQLQEQLLAERGGVPFPNSWELINEARRERLDALP